MKPLSESSKAILASYRGSQSLPDAARRRALSRLHVRIAAGVAPPDAMNVPPPEPVSQGFLAQWLGGSLAKIGLGIIAVAIPAALLLSHRSAPTVAVEKKAQPVHVEALVAPTSSASAPTPSVQAPENDAPERTASAPPVPAPERLTAGDQPKPTTKAAATTPSIHVVLDEEDESAANTDTIDEEVALLSRAHAALRAGRPAEALAQLTEHARRFPSSKLAESREATRILALCASGQNTRARTEAEQFLLAHPASTFTSRVKNACTG